MNEGGGGTIYDLSGYGNHGTLTSMANPGTALSGWWRGHDGPSLEFDGANDIVDCGSDASLDDLRPLSVSAWIRPTTTNDGYYVGKRDAAGNGYWRISFDDVGGSETIQFWKDNNPGIALRVRSADGAVPIDQWNHVVVTWDGSLLALGVHIYVNGHEVEYKAQTDGTIAVTSDAAHSLWMGARGGAGSSQFDGGLSDVRLYNRELSPTQVFALYAHPYAVFVWPEAYEWATIIVGSTTWGHDQGVVETNIRDFAGNWTGTGTVIGAGDAEQIVLNSGENMVGEVVGTGDYIVRLRQNVYDVTGDDVILRYRTGATVAACEAAAWNNYVAPFLSLGFSQVRLEATF